MKIKKIILHPFAGIVNKTIEFDNGLNVVLGDNETGKSTLIKALTMVLFESTKQTPAKEKLLLENLLPVGGGDVVAVDLEFDFEGQTYHLKKQWGKSKYSSIHKNNEAPVTDPDEVQCIMDEILIQNRLVWENVMFTSQAKLSLTHNTIEGNKQISTTLDSLLQNSIINNAGMAPEDIQQKIEEELKKLTNNWNIQNNLPAYGSNNKGSYDNPYINNVGKILELYYKIYELNAKLDARKKHDYDYDVIVNDIETRTQKYNDEVKSFLDVHRDHIEDFRKRTSLIKDKQIIEAGYKVIENDYSNWTKAASQIDLLEESYENAKNAKDELEAEMEISNKKKNGNSILEKFISVTDLSDKISKLQEDQKKHIFIKTEDQKTIKELHSRFKELNAQFDSYKKLQSFNVEVVSINNISIDITNGNDPKTKVDLFTAVPHVFKADGSFELKSHELKINVIADAENLKACEDEIENIKKIQSEISQSYSVDSMDSLIDSHKSWSRIEEEIKNNKTLVSSLLGNQTIEDLTEAANALNTLKPTRSLEDLKDAYKKAVQLEADTKSKYDFAQKHIQDYTLKYLNISELKKKDFEASRKLDEIEEKINNLTQLPDEEVSPEQLIQNYDAKLREESNFKEKIQELQLEKTRLEGKTDEISTAEYEDQISILSAEKAQKIAEAKAILRVKEKLEEIINRAPANPYDGYHNQMRHYLSLLSGGKYADFNIDKSLPESIQQQNNVPLKPGMLSQGTSGLLGLALRLSMADYFLREREGFLIMDDPMTDMDAGRQTNTVNCLSDYAQNRQVIVFTCHKSHADQFEGKKINLN